MIDTIKVKTCVTYSVQLHPALQPINITIWRNETNGWLSSDSRYLFKTPMHRQADLPSPMGEGQNGFDEAIADVVKHLDSLVVQATNSGHQPDSSWRVRNRRSDKNG